MPQAPLRSLFARRSRWRAAIAGLMLGWFLPLQFLPAKLPGRWLGAAVFVLAFALFAWAVATMTRVSPDFF
jgi:hypothetical protein